MYSQLYGHGRIIGFFCVKILLKQHACEVDKQVDEIIFFELSRLKA